MGFKELEEEVDPQEKAATTEPMEDGGVDIERPTSTTSKAVPQEPTLTMELAEKINNTKTTKQVPQQVRTGELVYIADEGT